MVEVAPLPVEVALGAEELHPVVLAIGDEHTVARVHPDAVRRGELSAARPRRAPRAEVPALGREAVHGGVAVPVGDVDLAPRRHRDVGRMVERRL